jgi:hypothetical protein
VRDANALVDFCAARPFTRAGNTEFNIVLWMPPERDRKGDIVLVDSTHFRPCSEAPTASTASGATSPECALTGPSK